MADPWVISPDSRSSAPSVAHAALGVCDLSGVARETLFRCAAPAALATQPASGQQTLCLEQLFWGLAAVDWGASWKIGHKSPWHHCLETYLTLSCGFLQILWGLCPGSSSWPPPPCQAQTYPHTWAPILPSPCWQAHPKDNPAVPLLCAYPGC